MLIFQGSWSGTNIANAIALPSGDHCGLDGVSVTWVTCVVAPSASIQRTNSCVPLGSPSARYRIRAPSGDQRAPEPFTRKRFLEPSAFIIQSADSHLSSILLT